MFFNSLNRKLKKSYSVVNPEIGRMVFPGGEDEYIYVGTILNALFSKQDIFELLKVYVSVYTYYKSTMGNTAKTYSYAKKKTSGMLTDGEVKNLIALVMLNLTASKAGVSDPVAAVRQYRGFVDSYLETVEGIQKNAWRFKPDTIDAGTINSPLLVDGVCGVRDYINALKIPGVEEITYKRISSLHLTDENCRVSYAIDEYKLFNAKDSSEIATLWFNIYGTENTDVQPACFSDKTPFSADKLAPELFETGVEECQEVEEICRTAQDISDEILGGAIRFCQEANFKLNVKMLTFLWSALLVSAKEEICKHNLLEDVFRCYTHSLSSVYPKILEDDILCKKVDEMRQHHWNTLSKDYSTLTNEDELSAFLQVAGKLDGQSCEASTQPPKADSSKAFAHISSIICSNINNILRQNDNSMLVQYRGVIAQYRFAKSQQKPATQKQEVPQNIQSVTTIKKGPQPELGMAWYKFLKYFALILGPIFNFIYSLGYLSGSVYMTETNGQVTADQMYAYYGTALQLADVVYGFFLIGFALFALVVRSKLANFDSDAPKFVTIHYSIAAFVPFTYTIIVASITSQPIVDNAFVSLIIALLFLLLNIKYFKKRAHLFADQPVIVQTSTQNSSTIMPQPIRTPAKPIQNTVTHTPKALFCRKCGAKLMEDDCFCHNCGIQIIKRNPH